MKEITLKEWSEYLPYGLNIHVMGEYVEDGKLTIPKDFEMVGLNTSLLEYYEIGRTVSEEVDFRDCKPILRDLSDLTKEIENNGQKIVPVVLLAKMRSSCSDSFPLEKAGKALINDLIGMRLPYDMVEKLLEWKFNVFQIPDELIVKVTNEFNPYK